MTALIRAVLKMSAHAYRAGSAMNRDSGLTNARWILIDKTAEAEAPLTISEHARRPGFSRQALKRLAADMVRDGLSRHTGELGKSATLTASDKVCRAAWDRVAPAQVARRYSVFFREGGHSDVLEFGGIVQNTSFLSRLAAEP